MTYVVYSQPALPPRPEPPPPTIVRRSLWRWPHGRSSPPLRQITDFDSSFCLPGADARSPKTRNIINNIYRKQCSRWDQIGFVVWWITSAVYRELRLLTATGDRHILSSTAAVQTFLSTQKIRNCLWKTWITGHTQMKQIQSATKRCRRFVQICVHIVEQCIARTQGVRFLLLHMLRFRITRKRKGCLVTKEKYKFIK